MMLYLEYPDWIRPEIIPGLPFQWYGLMYLVAFAVTYVLFVYQVKERRLDIEEDTIANLFLWTILGLLVGARLFATLIFDETGYYWRHPLRIFWPFDQQGRFVGLQGMNYYGGLIGAVVAVVAYVRHKKEDLLEWGDMLVAGIPLGYTFGRLGNFINGELYGRVTTVPWGMMFPKARRFEVEQSWVQEVLAATGLEASGEMVNLPRHPTQLYEAITEGIISWVLIWFVFRKRRPFPGFIIAFYVLSYGVFRFAIDYFRMPLGSDYLLKFGGDSIPPYLLLTPWNFITSQLFSFAMILAGLLLLFYFRSLRKDANAAAFSEDSRRTARNRARRRRRE